MLCSKNILTDINDVSPSWVFSYYCEIPLEEFTGAEFKSFSVFQQEKTPSMSFYVKDDKYRFTDYSSGLFGDHIDLVMFLYKLKCGDACGKILTDYNKWTIKTGQAINYKQISKRNSFKVSEWDDRAWNKSDADFWIPFNIGTSLLREYNVKPLYSYTLKKGPEEFKVLGDNLYGYFKKNGELYKVYQPFNQEKKFIKNKDFIQGSEQVKKRPFIGYLSSLKDIMAFESLGLNADVKAPDSENTLLPDAVVKSDLEEYNGGFILFDIDQNEAGQKAAKRYQDVYGIPPVYLMMGPKDLSDCIKEFGPVKVRNRLVPLIDKVLNTQ